MIVIIIPKVRTLLYSLQSFFKYFYLILASSKLGKAREKQGEVRFKPQFTGNLGENF